MKKRYSIFSFLIVAVVLGIVCYRLVDDDALHTLPESQKITTQVKSNISSSNPFGSLDHIVIITMENKSYSDIVGSANAPYINSLINKYSFADNYFAVSHPSLPNYIALIGGSTFGITSDCTDCYVHAPNLVDQLEQVHKTWKAYMESMPTPCFIGNSYPYAQKHDPFIYFDDIRKNQQRCQRIVPYAQLSSNLQSIQTTPNFVWISPNLCSDMHDCSAKTGDTWLSQQVPNILASPAFTQQKSLLIITWDEGEGSGNNQIPTLLIGNTVKQHYISHTLYSHYSLLHTIETVWNIPPLTTSVAQSSLLSNVLHITK